MTAAAIQERESSGSILFVDDEKQILSSLRRLCRRDGYQVHVASSGAEGLAILGTHEVDIVVSDMRMPGMNGAEFLEKAANDWPDVLRILLTGYSEIEAAIAAVNLGRVFRYLNKPWDDLALKQTLDEAMQVRNLRREKTRLEALTLQQNEELKAFSAELEERVERRTLQIRAARDELQQAYVNSVEVFSSLIRSGTKRTSETMRKIADQARTVGKRLELPSDALETLHLAGLLCDLGKLSLSDEVKDTPYALLSPTQLEEFHKHPIVCENALVPLGPLEKVGTVLRSHCESVDGNGYPHKLAGEDIPIESRILCVVKDFDALTSGFLTEHELTAGEALAYIRGHINSKYDANVVSQFEQTLRLSSDDQSLDEKLVSVPGLQPNMEVTRDVYNSHGMLLLPKGMLLTTSVITRLHSMDSKQDEALLIYVVYR